MKTQTQTKTFIKTALLVSFRKLRLRQRLSSRQRYWYHSENSDSDKDFHQDSVIGIIPKTQTQTKTSIKTASTLYMRGGWPGQDIALCG